MLKTPDFQLPAKRDSLFVIFGGVFYSLVSQNVNFISLSQALGLTMRLTVSGAQAAQRL